MDFLYLKENKGMVPLTSDFFPNSSSLTKLWIQNNAYERIPKHTFKNVPNIEYLSLTSDQIQEFEDGSLDDLPKLKGIFLKANKITSLPKNLFRKHLDLEEIDLAGNQIQIIDVSLIKNTKLRNLFFSENKINSINPATFYKKRALRHCYFKDNLCVNKVFHIHGSLHEMKMDLEDCFLNYTEITNEVYLLINENSGTSMEPTGNSSSGTINIVIILQTVVLLVTIVGIVLYAKLR
jgi:Leucine-rich repeat (LRR) protein